jgi:isopentenyl-diphosphate delta-isomerase
MNQSIEDFENRKRDHIRLSLDSLSQSRVDAGYSRIRLKHLALPEIDFNEVELKTHLLGHHFSSPHFISSMTAGHTQSLDINLNLARAAEKMNWLMAVGSQRRELTDQAAQAEWAQIRTQVKNVKFVSNIGLSEVISQPVEQIVRLAETLDSIGLIVHLNPLQEVFQNMKNGHFKGGIHAIENLVKKSKIPVLIKEVGFGINEELVEKLFSMGVHVIDLAGHGGTHWGMIEAARAQSEAMGVEAAAAFSDWGYSNVELLLKLQEVVLFNHVWASGGIRSGVDTAKCMALGARAVGVAQPLMKAAVLSEEAVLKVMKTFDEQLKVAMFCVGVRKCDEFLHKKVWL